MLLMALVETNSSNEDGLWFLDSECSNHMCGNRLWFSNLNESFRHKVKLENNYRMQVMGKGDVQFKIDGNTHTFTNVYYVPDLCNSLLSIDQLQERGVDILIQRGCCKIYHSRKVLIFQTWMTPNRMFVLSATRAKETAKEVQCLQTSTENITQLWHQRYAHLNYKGLRTLRFRNMVGGLPQLNGSANGCTSCFIGKQHRQPFPKKSQWHAVRCLQLVHSDLCGHISPSSNHGKKYMLTFIDDYNRKVWTYFLANKSPTYNLFKQLKTYVEKETCLSLTCWCTDRGVEFNSNEFNLFCKDAGISRQLTTTYTPQQNGIAEQKNCTIMTMVRCILNDIFVPKEF